MLDYLHNFAEHFDLRPQIELNRKVTYIRPIDNNLWEVTFANGEQRIYKGVLLCNGHHWCKRFPEFEGTFNGEIIHSKDYKRPEELQGKRVLVIGSGNSACDVAAESGRVGAKCVMSMRQSPWFIPKSFAGVPVVDLIKWWMPEWLQRLMIYSIIRLTFGTHESYGLPKPKYRIFDRHPTLNNEVPYYIKHGRITPKPAVRRLDGWEVEFEDGSREEFDLIVCATGFHLAYPFLPPELQRIDGSVVKCYGQVFLDDYKGLYYVGWGQIRGGVGSLVSAFAPLFVRYLQLQDKINVPIGLVLKELGQKLPKTHLFDPHQIFIELKLNEVFFDVVAKKAERIDAKYNQFNNEPLAPLSSVQETQATNLTQQVALTPST